MLDLFSNYANGLAQSSLADPVVAFPAYILAGFASSLFPCVYPLIPITVGFLQKRSEIDQSRWKHPLFYWLGTIIAYTSLGLVAAIGGGAFNAVMQNGLFILFTGILFLFLCFVLIDWFPFSIGTGTGIVQRASRHSGLYFTTVMGFGAGFVASACVAPALVAMLLFIAKHAAGSDSLLSGIGYGAFLSAGFGIGIGIPFFVSGVLGARLPRSGNWMTLVKYFFALLIAVAGFYQMHKGFSVLGFENTNVYLIFFGIALIGGAVLLGLKPPEKNDRRALTLFFFALIALASGFGTIVRGFFPSQTGHPATVQATFETNGSLRFHRNPDSAFAEAKQKNLPVFIDFYADWCANCKDFYNLANKNRALNEALQGVVLLKIHDTDAAFAEYAKQDEFHEINIGLPFFAVMDPDETVLWKTTNYRDSDGMIAAIRSGLH